jgi:hypothetical protein
LTSIFILADATKLPIIIQTFKRCLLADCVESFNLDSTQSADKHLLKVWIFLGNFVAHASMKIDVNKFYKIYQLDHLFRKVSSQVWSFRPFEYWTQICQLFEWFRYLKNLYTDVCFFNNYYLFQDCTLFFQIFVVNLLLKKLLSVWMLKIVFCTYFTDKMFYLVYILFEII